MHNAIHALQQQILIHLSLNYLKKIVKFFQKYFVKYFRQNISRQKNCAFLQHWLLHKITTKQ